MDISWKKQVVAEILESSDLITSYVAMAEHVTGEIRASWRTLVVMIIVPLAIMVEAI